MMITANIATLGLHVLVVAAIMVIIAIIALKIETQRFLSLAIALGCALIMLLSRTLSLYAAELTELTAFYKLEGLGLCYFLFFGLVFIAEWKDIRVPRSRFIWLFVINTIFFLLILTFDHNTLYFTQYGIGRSELTMSGRLLTTKGEILYYVHQIVIIAQWLALLGCYLYVSHRDNSYITVAGGRYRRTIPVFLTTMVIAFLVGTEASGHGEYRTLVTSIVAVGWALLALLNSTYDTVQLAKENLIKELDECFIVLSGRLQLQFANPEAQRLMTETGRSAFLDKLREALQKKQYLVAIGGRTYTMHRIPVQPRDSDKVIGYALNLVDISDITRRTEQMRAMKEKAEMANQIKSDFISTVSHEIRTPMNVIVGMTDIMLRENLPDTLREYLNNIKTSGSNLLAIINDILDVSKVESGKMEVVEEAYFTGSFISDLGLMFLSRIKDKPLDLVFDIDPRLPSTLMGDVVRIRQIVVNLMTNAIKFTDSGEVRLSIRIDEMENDAVFLCFTVSDTGTGIREEDMGKLFREFAQVNVEANHHKEGTGLGLALSKKLAHLMQGDLRAESVWGEGSSFILTIRQKIVDEAPLAALKEQSRQTVAYISQVPRRRAYVKSLFEDYRLNDVTDDLMTGGSVQPEFIFLDREDYQAQAASLRQKYHQASLAVLRNATQDTFRGEAGDILVDLPFYSSKLCRVLNHETAAPEAIGQNTPQFTYTAPEARILLVDDNDMNRVVAKGLLLPLRLNIDEAANGKVALEMIQSGRYDIVLMDHMMPVMDGVEATKAIRALPEKKYQQLPIIALTANAAADARRLFEAAGMNDFAMKPIDVAELVEKIKQYLPPELIKELAEKPKTEAPDEKPRTEMPKTGAEKAAETTAKTDAETSESKLPAAGPSGETPEEDSEEAQLARALPGLDVKQGIKNCAAPKMYRRILGMFAVKTDSNIEKLQGLFDEGKLEELTIEVHALKNNARLIGDIPLSEIFFRMELAGKQGNIEEFEKSLPEVFRRMQELKPLLLPFAKGK